MCVAIEYEAGGQRGVIEPCPPGGRLPLSSRGVVHWMRWGALDTQDDEILLHRPGYGPRRFAESSFAALDQIRAGKWWLWEPRPARIMASRFAMAHSAGGRQFFAVPSGSYIQGLVARIDHWRRLYVVTVGAPESFAKALLEPHRWPRIVTAAAKPSA